MKFLMLIWRCFIILFVFFFVFFYLIASQPENGLSAPHRSNETDLPVMIWWTPFTGLSHNVRKCHYGSCIFTEDRKYLHKNRTKAILFYGSDFQINDLPLPREWQQWWGLLHEESPKNQPLFDFEDTLSLFNLTSTFKSSSGMPLTLLHLESIEVLISREYYVPTKAKNSLLDSGNISPILYLQSDCNPPSQRDSYVKELSNFIQVDSYGLCLNNKQLPNHLYGIENINHPGLLKLIANYKFTIAFENSACEDYITEKLWRPLTVGSIPIYWGSPSVQAWLPNNQSIIHVRDFKTPQELSFYLLEVLKNDTLYEEHLQHKITQLVKNERLVSSMQARTWGISETEEESFVDAFECFVCDSVWRYHKNTVHGMLVADRSHYGCPPPATMMGASKDQSIFWVEQWYKSKAEAEVLHNFVHSGIKNFSLDLFYEKVISLLNKRGHFKRFNQEEL